MLGEQTARRIATGEIEVAPLAFMRGRTLAHAFVILDEAQNATAAADEDVADPPGRGRRMAVTGDPSQIGLPGNVTSGLTDALSLLEGVEGVGV